ADLRGEFAAILAQAVQIEAALYRPHSWRVVVSSPVTDMLAAKALRNQHFHGLPQHLRARVAEDFLRSGVDQHNPSLTVHNHNGVRCGLQQSPELIFPSRRRDFMGHSFGHEDLAYLLAGAVRAWHQHGAGMKALTVLAHPGRVNLPTCPGAEPPASRRPTAMSSGVWRVADVALRELPRAGIRKDTGLPYSTGGSSHLVLRL